MYHFKTWLWAEWKIFLRDVYKTGLLWFFKTMLSLWYENWIWVENLFLILLKEGDRESPAPPLMPQESETERNGFIITSYFVDLKTIKYFYLLAMYSHFSPPNFQNYNRQNPKVSNPLSKVSIWGPHGEILACRERRRTRRGSRRLLIRCCSRPPSDGAGNSHLSMPQNSPFPGISNLLRQKIFLDAAHRRPVVLLFQFWILMLDEETTLDVSDGPAYSGFVTWSERRLDLCLKRPSFYCLIHFYKRCVSSLAHMSVTTFFIQG